MSERKVRSDAFFSYERLEKLADTLIGRDKQHYKAVRSALQEKYTETGRKTPFAVTWTRAIEVLRRKYDYAIPHGTMTTHMKEQLRLQRLNYERRKANEEEAHADLLHRLNNWKENF